VSSFRRTRHGVVVSFDEAEASLLRHLVGEVRGLLSPQDDGAADDRASADGDGGGEPTPDQPTPDQPTPDQPTPDQPTPDQPTPDQLAALTGIGGLGGDPPEAPEDPVLSRLLPDGYRDDSEAAEEFRRLTESTLRQQKCAAADRVLADLAESGGTVRLDAETTETWLAALNDVRLALGTRLDVQEDMADPDPDDPDAAAYVVYVWLTELQDVLVEVAAENAP
jgi:Domain of unknown function (DUF2017)